MVAWLLSFVKLRILVVVTNQPVSSLWLPSPPRYLDPEGPVQSDQRLLERWRVSRNITLEGSEDTLTDYTGLNLSMGETKLLRLF